MNTSDIIFEDSVPAQVFLVRAENEAQAWKQYLERERHYFEQPDGTYPIPAGITLRRYNQLYELLDHGGNFHGGMIADSFGTRYWGKLADWICCQITIGPRLRVG